MTSSLAEQLKKLQVPQTSLLLQDKHRQSLLFDPREAATLDRDTVHAIGLTGLEELVILDPSFTKFHGTLFSEHSKQVERSVQTAEVNQQLNDSISRFLRVLSPYFLLRAAHKALEWLIYRFHVHLYNVDDMISCVLPFHESRIFVRVVQLLDLRDPAGRWHWLMPLQKPGLPLSKSTLITHCYKDLSFMKLICDLVPNFMEAKGSSSPNQSVVGFYVVAILGALEHASKVSEDILSCLLPYMLRGLKSPSLDYCAATYMILSQIAAHASLSESVVARLLSKMAQYIKEEFLKEYCVCILVIFQHQNVTIVPEEVLSLLKKNSLLQEELELASKQFQTKSFVKPLLITLIDELVVLREDASETEATVKLISRILSGIGLDEQIVVRIVKTLFKAYLKQLSSLKSTEKTGHIESLQRNALFVLGLLEKKYPEICDRTVESFLDSCKSGKTIQLQKLLGSGSRLPEHWLVKESTTPLFLALNHPSHGHRKSAIRTLASAFREGKIPPDSSFLRDSMSARLEDDNPKVVLAVISLKQSLFKICPKEELMQKLLKILSKTSSRKWTLVHQTIVTLLCGEDANLNSNERDCLTVAVLPFLFPTYDFETVRLIFASHLAQTQPLLQHLSVECKETLKAFENTAKDFVKWADVIIKSVKNMPGKMDSSLLLPLVEILILEEKSAVLSHYMALLLLQQILAAETEQAKQVALSKSIFSVVKKVMPFVTPGDDSANTLLTCMRKGHVPLDIVSSSLTTLIQTLPKERKDIFDFKMDLFCFLSSDHNSELKMTLKMLLKAFLEKQFESTASALSFLSCRWSDHFREEEQKTESQLQLASLSAAREILCSVQEGIIENLLRRDSTELLCLFLSLLCPEVKVRILGLECLRYISINKPKSNNALLSLIATILQHSEEIVTDENQFQQVLEHWFSPALDTAATPTELTVLKDWLSLCLSPSIPPHVQYGALLSLQNCQGQNLQHGVLPICRSILDAWEPVGLIEPLPYQSLAQVLSKWNIARLLNDPKCEPVVLLKRVLSSKVVNTKGQMVQHLALKTLSRCFFEEIPCVEVQYDILGLVLDLYLESRDGENGNVLFRTLLKMCGNTQVVLKHLKVPDQASSEPKQTVKDIRKLRASNPTGKEGIQVDWKSLTWSRISSLLEVILSLKEDPRSLQLLLTPLFDLLKCILDCSTEGTEDQEVGGKEYILQLLLSTLHRVVSSSSFSSENEEAFQVDLVVQCVRLTRHEQTQRQAHMLLNVAGQFFPERVLHSVMSVFTFMGSSLLRKEDNFSFQVVVQTVDTIVPALIAAKVGSQEKSGLEGVAAAVTRVFVDAVYDIPSQRRVPVFCRLVSALGDKRSLWLPLLQLVDVAVLKPRPSEHTKVQDKSTGSVSPAIQFATLLSAEFSPAVQVNTALKIVAFLSQLPFSKEEWVKNQEKSQMNEIIDLKLYSETQLQHFKYTAASFLCSLLSSEPFLEKVISVKAKNVSKLEKCYQKLLQSLLMFIQSLASTKQTSSANTKYLKAILHKLYDLLDKVTSLLPSDQFLNVISSLGDHSVASIRRKSLEMLNSKLLNQPTFFGEQNHSSLLALLRPLMKTSKSRRTSKETSSTSEETEEKILNQQTALFTIKLLAKLLGEAHPAAFAKVLGSLSLFLQQRVSADSKQPQLLSSILLCIAELCSCLHARALPFLNTFMPPLLALLQDDGVLRRNDLLLLSAVTTVHRLVEHLPAFLSSYLPILLMQVCIFSSAAQSSSSASASDQTDSSQQKSTSVLQQRLQSVRSLISSAIPGRVLLPIVQQCYQNMLESKKHKAIGPLMSVLSGRISSFGKSEFSAHLQEMQKIFLTALDFRNCESRNLMPRVNEVEGHILEAAYTLVLKLSESSFRPFFYQLYEWATEEEEENKDRIITFYRLAENLAVKLKSLFVLFANHFVKNAADILNANNPAKCEQPPWGSAKRGQEKSCQLLRHVLSTLHSCFLHDSQSTLVDEECFQTLSQPLLDQLENTLGGEEQYQARVTELLCPCLAQLAVAANDDSCWKPFQYQMLLKTRHTDPKVRFAALEALQELATKLGDDYVTLLPEAIPFLAELMEDESVEVEQQCQSVVSKMEQLVGEPLMKYF